LCAIANQWKHRRLLVSAGVTIPAAFWLLSMGPPETEHGLMPERPVVKDHGEENEEAEAAPSDDSESEGEQKDTPPSSDDEGDEKPSERDPVRIIRGI
jgi:hypothetical protein